MGTAFTPSAIDSRLPDEAWLELRYLHVSSPTGAFLSPFIKAHAKIPSEEFSTVKLSKSPLFYLFLYFNRTTSRY